MSILRRRGAGGMLARGRNEGQELTTPILTPTEEATLCIFLTNEIAARRDHPHGRQDIEGVMSGRLFNVLKLPTRHPEIAQKLKNRSGLVTAAENLKFVINVGRGGSSRGTVAWESIDLSENNRQPSYEAGEVAPERTTEGGKAVALRVVEYQDGDVEITSRKPLRGRLELMGDDDKPVFLDLDPESAEWLMSALMEFLSRG